MIYIRDRTWIILRIDEIPDTENAAEKNTDIRDKFQSWKNYRRYRRRIVGLSNLHSSNRIDGI